MNAWKIESPSCITVKMLHIRKLTTEERKSEVRDGCQRRRHRRPDAESPYRSIHLDTMRQISILFADVIWKEDTGIQGVTWQTLTEINYPFKERCDFGEKTSPRITKGDASPEATAAAAQTDFRRSERGSSGLALRTYDINWTLSKSDITNINKIRFFGKVAVQISSTNFGERNSASFRDKSPGKEPSPPFPRCSTCRRNRFNI